VKTAEDFGPDIILILHAWRCAAVFDALRARFGVPAVVSLRGTDANEMLEDPDRGPTIVRILDASDAVTVFHEALRDGLALFASRLVRKSHVIPNGLKLPASDVNFRHRLGIPAGAFAFVNLSGLREVKGPLALLERLARLRKRYPGVHFLHAGPGIERRVTGPFMAFARAHAWVHHEDAVPHEEIDSFLRAGDVYVSASRSEGMPHAVGEAMAVGLPALLSDIPGHRAMARPGAEALFYRESDDFLIEAGRLVENGSLRAALGSAARKRAHRNLIGSDEVGDYVRLFERLLRKTAVGPGTKGNQ
jgi:glycosyltransferase involved in cell wall biosynthesis